MKKWKFIGKNVLVYGASKSGIAAAKLLVRNGIRVTLYDDDLVKLDNAGDTGISKISKFTNNMMSYFSAIIVTPAIDKNNDKIILAKQCNIPVLSELELGSLFTKCPIIAITGTNGKTTTVELLTAMLSTTQKAYAVGNIGYPLCQAILDNKKGIFVAEVSSFMLEHCEHFAPNIATITNITPDHQDRYESIQEYQNIKLTIFNNLQKNGASIINLDCAQAEAIRAHAKGKVYFYSRKQCDGLYIENNIVFNGRKGTNKEIVLLDTAKLKGIHNESNILCAISIARLYKVNNHNIKKVLDTFVADHHRYEYIDTIKGVEYINDSKSTNVDSTIQAILSNNKKTHLLIGGSNKGLDYAPLAKALPKYVTEVYCFGSLADEMYVAITGNSNIKCSKYDSMQAAVSSAKANAKKNHIVLLSPASASFDEFDNYEDRARKFVQLVNGINE